MTKRTLPTPETLRQLLRYDPETGKLFWRERGPEWFPNATHSREHNQGKWNSRLSGKEALSGRTKGYATGMLLNGNYAAHRVIWAIVYGVWPEAEIDHINGVKHDNRIVNLREASRGENSRNIGLRSNNSSGYKGVSGTPKRRSGRRRSINLASNIILGFSKILKMRPPPTAGQLSICTEISPEADEKAGALTPALWSRV